MRNLLFLFLKRLLRRVIVETIIDDFNRDGVMRSFLKSIEIGEDKTN